MMPPIEIWTTTTYRLYREKFQRELDSPRTSKKRKSELTQVIAEIDKYLSSQNERPFEVTVNDFRPQGENTVVFK